MNLFESVTFVGACAAIIGTWYSISNSKKSVLKKIERKEAQIKQIDHELIMRYGLNSGAYHPYTSLDKRKHKLKNQIEMLKRYL